MKVLLFAGTKNGRLFAGKLLDQGFHVIISSLTAHGSDLLPEHPMLDKRFGPVSESAIEEMIEKETIEAVIDATHPYAAEISHNIIDACRKRSCPVYRLERKSGFGLEDGRHFESMESACAYLGSVEGNVLLTTGSNQVDIAAKHLSKERITVRLLPVESSVKKATDCGLNEAQILALNPPFGLEENLTHIKEHQIKYLLTKDGGAIGGTYAKLEAVQKAGIELIIIDRPVLGYEWVYYSGGELIKAMRHPEEHNNR